MINAFLLSLPKDRHLLNRIVTENLVLHIWNGTQDTFIELLTSHQIIRGISPVWN